MIRKTFPNLLSYDIPIWDCQKRPTRYSAYLKCAQNTYLHFQSVRYLCLSFLSTGIFLYQTAILLKLIQSRHRRYHIFKFDTETETLEAFISILRLRLGNQNFWYRYWDLKVAIFNTETEIDTRKSHDTETDTETFNKYNNDISTETHIETFRFKK